MYFVNNIIINIYSLILLVVIYAHAIKHVEKDLLYKYYFIMVRFAMLLLIIDVFGRFDGNPGSIFPVINYWGNFLLFLLGPVLPSIWLLYIHQTFYKEKNMRRLFRILLLINAANVAFVVLSQFYGWIYTIDSSNIYHRGPLFAISASIALGLIFAALLYIVRNRKKLEKKVACSLMLFAVPPFVCIIMQTFIYGVSLMFNGLVLSLLIIYLNVQNRNMYTDFLTGANNRMKLETYMQEKINASTENKAFSAILLDIDNFKAINDTYGHDVGDDALQTSVKLLKSCLRSNDFIARFGGDEFYIILDISNAADLEAAIDRINNCVEKFNEAASRPYRLGFSKGYAVYDRHSHMNAEEFQKLIDILMYENKQFMKKNGIVYSG